MDGYRIYCIDRSNLATLDSAVGFPSCARVRDTLSSARVAGLDLPRNLAIGPCFADFGTIDTIRNLWKPFCSFFASTFLLSRSTSISTLGVSAMAVQRDLDMLRVGLANPFDAMADGKCLFLLGVR